MTRLFFVTLCVLAAVLPAAMGMGSAAVAPDPADDPAPECGSLEEYESTDEYRDCLAEHTTGADVMEIVEHAPANVSQKSIDSVYTREYRSDLNESEREKATEWMTWEKFGIKPGWVDSATGAVENATAEENATEGNASTATMTSSPTPTNPSRSNATATATDSSTSTATATPEPAGLDVTGGATAEADTLENQETIRMGEHTEIVGWEFSDGTVRIAIATERTQFISMADQAVGLDQAGASKIPQVEQRIFGGETTIVSMPVKTAMGGHAVGVAAGDSSIRITTEMDQSGDDPLRHFGGTSGLFSGFLQAVLAALGAAWYVLRTEESGVVKA